MKFNILIITLFLLHRFGNTIGMSKKSEGFCFDNRTSLQNTLVCCRNYEFIDKSCIACEVGYHTIEAGRGKCKPCPPNKYGKKCGGICICKANESCDNKDGSCIPRTTFKTLTEYWTYSRYQRQSTEDSNTRIKVDVNLTQNKVNSQNTTTNNSWPILNYVNVAVGCITLVVMSIFATIVLVKRRSRMTGAVDILPPVNALHNPASNQAVEDVALDILNHDYEEIDETVLNDIQEFQNMQLEESDSDSTRRSTGKPSEDAEGYLNPYHSLLHHCTKWDFKTVNSAKKCGSSYSDQNPYDSLILSRRIGCLITKSMSQGTIVKTTKNCNQHSAVNRVTI